MRLIVLVLRCTFHNSAELTKDLEIFNRNPIQLWCFSFIFFLPYTSFYLVFLYYYMSFLIFLAIVPLIYFGRVRIEIVIESIS